MIFLRNLPAPALLLVAAMAVFMILTGCSNNREPFPVTEKRPVAEEHFGTKTVDNYRWLDNLDDPAVRVDPANSRKMAARLQAATSSGLPILLRTNPKAGHGIGTGLSDRIHEEADVYAYLCVQLNIPYRSK